MVLEWSYYFATDMLTSKRLGATTGFIFSEFFKFKIVLKKLNDFPTKFDTVILRQLFL